MCSKAKQDEGRLQPAQVSPILFCDLHGPKRKESRDVFKPIMCNFHCHDKTASALAQGSPMQECVGQAVQAPGEDHGNLAGISLGTMILDTDKNLHIYLHSPGMVFSFDHYLNSFQRPETLAQNMIF